MARATVEAKFRAVLDGLDEVLSEQGFRKHRSSWRWFTNGNCALIEVQRSQSSTADAIRFTANLGVISGRLLAVDSNLLLAEGELDISRVGSDYAHLRQRIGWILPAPEDRWWTIDDRIQVPAVLSEVIPSVRNAVDFLRQHVDDADLIRIWESGRSPGLTELQRQRNLRLLTSTS